MDAACSERVHHGRVAANFDLPSQPSSELSSPPCPAAELALRACSLVDALLADHLDLLFGQHLSVAIACALFFTVGGRWRPYRTCRASGLGMPCPIRPASNSLGTR